MQGCVSKKRERWYIRYYIGKDENGKWVQKWEGSWATKKEAEKVLRSRIDELEGTFERKADNSTMEVYLLHWLETYCKPRLAVNTVNGYSVNVKKHIIPYIGNIQLNRLQPKDIQKLYSTLAANGLSGTSIRYVHNNLHKALETAVKQQIIIRNPADLVDAPCVDRFEANTLTPEQAVELLKACVGHEIYLPVLLALSLGLRRGEVLGLQWADIDLVRQTVTIRHSANHTKEGFILGTTKTKNSRRTLLMPDLLVLVLESVQAQQAIWKSKVGSDFNQFNLVCCREDGSPMTTNALQHQYRDILTANALPPIRFHDLRHTNATLMLRNSVPAKIVSSMLGHSSIGITLDTYSHVITEMQEGATSVMNSLFINL